MGSGVNDTPVGNPDLEAVFSSGEVFATRINQLKDAQTRAETALQELQLGQAAKVAHEEATRSLSEAKARRDEIMANTATEVNQIKEQLEAWKNSHQTKTLQDRQDASTALTNASTKESLISDLHVQAINAMADAEQKAKDILAKAKQDADLLIENAKATAESLTKDLELANQAASDSKSNSDALAADFQKKLDILKSAASTVGG